MTVSWKIIEGYPDYSVSDDGRVMRIKNGKNNFAKAGGILRPRIEANGYSYVNLYGENQIKRFSIHSLVCMHFCGKKPTLKHEVAHCDGVKSNNASSNLRWATRSENHADKLIHGTSQRGHKNGNSKLTLGQILDIRSSTLKLKEIANQHGVTITTIWKVRKKPKGFYYGEVWSQ